MEDRDAGELLQAADVRPEGRAEARLDGHARQALPRAADEDIHFRNRVAGERLRLRREDAVTLAELRRHRREEERAEEVQALEPDLRQLRHDFAVVGAGAADTESA